jgi:Mrr N-terminal domain
MNAWGLDPLLVLASTIYKVYGGQPPVYDTGPGDAELSAEVVTDGDDVLGENGTLVFPPRGDISNAILDLLATSALSSREMEDLLADKFDLTPEARQAKHPSGMPVWRNRVAFGLKDLVQARRIERASERRLPGGGTTRIYRLAR